MKIRTGFIQGGPRLARMLREQGKKEPGIMQRIPWVQVFDFVIGFGVLAAGCLVILFGIPILAAIVGP